jgi:hypothetical protein
MASTIVFRRGSTFPSQGSGITLAEPVFNTNLNTFHIGLGHGVTAEWIGAPISGASASISSAEAYKVPTAKAVKDYVTDYVTAVNGVLAVNGFAGGVTLAAGTGVSVAASSGTITITNMGVQSFNGNTGAVQGVSSINGNTGAISDVAFTNAAQSFSGLQQFIHGISASGLTASTALIETLDVRQIGDSNYVSIVPGSPNEIIARSGSELNIYSDIGSPINIGDYIGNGNLTYIGVHDHESIIRFNYGVESYIFPATVGSNGQVLTTNCVDTLSWSSVGTKTFQRFTPADNQPPTTNFATIDTRNSVMVLDFADSAPDESAIFVGVIPEGANLGSGIKVRLTWMATSATSGSVRWGAQFMNLNTDLDSDSFDTATEGNGTANGTSGVPTTTELTVTNIDSLAAGNFYRLKIYREASDTINDTMSGDAELISVEVRSGA